MAFLESERPKKVVAVYLKTHTTKKVWDKVQGSVDPRFAARLPFPVPKS